MNDEKLLVIDDQGNEIEMQILFTFEGDPTPEGEPGKAYVLYFNPDENDGTVYTSRYNQDGSLEAITNDKEWEMIEEVFATFMNDNEYEEE